MNILVFLLSFMIIIITLSFTKQDTAETSEEIEDSNPPPATENENEDDDVSSTFSQEWEQKMHDYEPNYVYMIPIKPRKSENFFEEINKVPVYVKGAFLTDENKKDKIEFIIVNPMNKMVYKNFTNECIFNFEATIPGKYRFKFRNAVSKQELKITFTMNTFQDEIIKKEHLSVTEEKINQIGKFMDSIKLEKDMLKNKLKDRRKGKVNFLILYFNYLILGYKKSSRSVFSFIVIETAVLIAVSVFQFFYIKNIISSKDN